MDIVDLRDATQHFDAAADRIWRAWWEPNGATLAEVETALSGSLGPDRFPFSLIASAEGKFAGTVSAIASDLDERPELGPWIAALWVEPAFRGQGVGEALMAEAVNRLRAQGFDKIYLCAQAKLRQYYLARGVTLLEQGVGEDKLDIFVLP